MAQKKCIETLADVLSGYSDGIESDLALWVCEPGAPEELAEAMRYCVLGGGKRLRPAVVHMVAEALDAEADELTRRAAVAVELIHCYSLVHDDLPAMDDDTLRRGRPTAHVRFGEAMAILAGDALLTRAFGLLAETSDPRSAKLSAELAGGAGAAGMIAGQVADMGLCRIPPDLAGLKFTHQRKTGAMIRSAVRMGAICARASDVQMRAVTRYGESMGLAFQVFDDLLDVTAEADVLGKTPGKDARSGKRTYVAEMGLRQATSLGRELTRQAVEALAPLGDSGENLRRLAQLLAERTH